MRWMLSKVIGLYLDLWEMVCEAKLERGNRRRYQTARDQVWRAEYVYYDKKKGWMLARPIAYPPTDELLREFPFWSKDGSEALARFQLEHTELL